MDTCVAVLGGVILLCLLLFMFNIHVIALGGSIICIMLGILHLIQQNSSVLDGMRTRTDGTISAGAVAVKSGNSIKSTPNPRYTSTDSDKTTEQEDTQVNPERPASLFETPTSTIRHPDYTPAALQRRLDERTFKKVEFTQSSAQRARMLDGMYKELVDTSVKRDPYLQRQKTKSTCSPLRGHTDPNRI